MGSCTLSPRDHHLSAFLILCSFQGNYAPNMFQTKPWMESPDGELRAPLEDEVRPANYVKDYEQYQLT